MIKKTSKQIRTVPIKAVVILLEYDFLKSYAPYSLFLSSKIISNISADNILLAYILPTNLLSVLTFVDNPCKIAQAFPLLHIQYRPEAWKPG